MAVATSLAIELELECVSPACREFAAPLLSQLALGRYETCSVLELPGDTQDWEDAHRTARRRARRAERLGYEFAPPFNRADYADDVFAINTSLERRQGRPMSAGYHERPSFGDDSSDCPRHGVHPYGVLRRGRLVAYAWIYRAGALALVSQILGHGDNLVDDVMFLLARGVVREELELGGYLVYNRHDSGTDGLRYFKERVGFEARPVQWLP